MAGKHNTEDMFKRVGKLNWEITCIKEEGSEEYQYKDIFNLAACSRNEFESVTLKKKNKVVDMPYFLCIKPTWFAKKDAFYVVFISGNKPSELKRVVMWFDCFGSNEPKFEYAITPLFDEQTAVTDQAHCAVSQAKDGKPVQTLALEIQSSGGGERGGGIGHLNSQ